MEFKTTVSEGPMDLSELFPVNEPADNQDKTPTTTLFTKTNNSIDLSAVDNKSETDKKLKEEADAEKLKTVTEPAKTTTATTTGIIDLDQLSTTQENVINTTDKVDLIDFFKEKIEAGELFTFSDFDETKQTLDEYLKGFKKKDFVELLKQNDTEKEKSFAEKLPGEFFETLPAELQYAAKYAADGGIDFKSLFKALAHVEEVKALDPVKDARLVNEQYLLAKKFGTSEDIKEMLDQWDDVNIQVKQAAKFHPELEKLQTELVQSKLLAQEQVDKDKKAAFKFYHDNVVEAIRTEDLGGIKLDKKTQSALYTGLTQYTFKDSRGKSCNELEYMLDQIMWVKPDYQKLAKLQWLLTDEEGLEKALSNKAVNLNTEETIRLLKTEQFKKKTSPEGAEPAASSQIKKINRAGGLFHRN